MATSGALVAGVVVIGVGAMLLMAGGSKSAAPAPAPGPSPAPGPILQGGTSLDTGSGIHVIDTGGNGGDTAGGDVTGTPEDPVNQAEDNGEQILSGQDGS